VDAQDHGVHEKDGQITRDDMKNVEVLKRGVKLELGVTPTSWMLCGRSETWG
jgi:hypothetical protein